MRDLIEFWLLAAQVERRRTMPNKHKHTVTHDHSHEEGHQHGSDNFCSPSSPVPPVDPNLHNHISRFVNSGGYVYVAERTHSHGWAGIPGDPHDHAFAPWNMEMTGEQERSLG